MKTQTINNAQIKPVPLKVITRNVVETLSSAEIQEALNQLHEKMKVPDPNNPNLWVVMIGKYKLWGILDFRAGPAQEDVLTLLFPEDY